MEPRTKHALAGKQRYQLMQLVEKEYTSRKQNDPDFAKYATETLGFTVNANHVGGCRTALDIPATRAVTSTSVVETRVTMLESECLLLKQRLKTLEDLVNRLMA